MTVEIYDANGNKVGSTGTCAKCGASIKHIFYFNGNTYGSSCIEAVTGVKPEYQVYKGSEFDLEASQQKQAKAAKDQTEQAAAYKAWREAAEATQAANAEKYQELLSILDEKASYSDFCWSMANDIRLAESSTRLEDILSPRALDIVAEIYAKDFGRRGSKKFEAALENFYIQFASEES